MSFAGTVFDMIRRSKENRELLNLRRNRAKSGKGLYLGRGNRPQNVTAEQLEQITRELREHEERQQRYITRMTLVIASVIVVSIILIYITIKFIF